MDALKPGWNAKEEIVAMQKSLMMKLFYFYYIYQLNRSFR